MSNSLWKANGQRLGLILGAVLVVTLIAVLPRDAPPIDPSDLDGDPDGNSLDRTFFFVACAFALLLYWIVVAGVRRRWSRRRGHSTDLAQSRIPRAAYFGAAPVLIYLLVVGDGGISLGYLVPVALAILAALLLSVSGRWRASGLAWVGGAGIGAALGCHVVWMASIATTV